MIPLKSTQRNDTPQEYKREMIPLKEYNREMIPLNSTQRNEIPQEYKREMIPSRVQKGNDTPQEYTKK